MKQIGNIDFRPFKRSCPPGFIKWFFSIEGQCVWVEFEKRALQMAARRDYYSAQTICEVIRWHTAISGGDDFKINNNWVGGLARVFLAKWGEEHPKFFRIRNALGWDE